MEQARTRLQKFLKLLKSFAAYPLAQGVYEWAVLPMTYEILRHPQKPQNPQKTP
jgi:hypothetical protein